VKEKLTNPRDLKNLLEIKEYYAQPDEDEILFCPRCGHTVIHTHMNVKGDWWWCAVCDDEYSRQDLVNVRVELEAMKPQPSGPI